MVPIGLFALGPRQVRCIRCKHQWLAALPNNIDVFVPVSSDDASPKTGGEGVEGPHTAIHTASGLMSAVGQNLPAVVRNGYSPVKMMVVAGILLFVGVGVGWPIAARDSLVRSFPGLRSTYEGLGLTIEHSGKGLIFNQVKSELRYDGGTMKLFVDGVIHNSTSQTQFIPDIKARALGPDQRIIQSWWVASPAATVAAGEDIPFHTEISTPMQRTIEDVYLEFYAQDEKRDVDP